MHFSVKNGIILSEIVLMGVFFLGNTVKKNISYKNRVIYFYSVDVTSSMSGEVVNNKLYEIFSDVFEKNAVNNSLRLASGTEFITMDILQNDENFLFARVGKIKPTAEMHLRNYDDYTCENILTPEQSGKFGVEIFTHFILDYVKGIIGFISGQSAPQPIILNNIVNQYTQTYVMELKNIVSENSVRDLLAPGSEITKFSYSFVVPEAGYLEKLNVPESAILQLATDEEFEVYVQVKSKKYRKALIFENEKMGAFIDNMMHVFSKDKKLKNLSLSGKTANSSTKDYKLMEQEFNAKVRIGFEVDDKGQIMYDSDTFRDRVLEVMLSEYKKNRDKLLLLANK